jgi:sucrose phosphorylase
MKNQVQLITYVDRFGGAGLKELAALLQGRLAGVFGGVHLLPFFHPIDGADAGFDPIDHTQVDPRLGDWSDIKALASAFEVMGDVIVNHVSSQSPQFLDFAARGGAAPPAGPPPPTPACSSASARSFPTAPPSGTCSPSTARAPVCRSRA